VTYDLIIFDYDGVVADSEVLNSTVMAEQLTAIGLPTSLDQVLATYTGRRWRDNRPVVEAALGRPCPEDFHTTWFAACRARGDVVVVEAAGGLFSPLTSATLGVDLAKEFSLPLVLVDAARLGAIGRTLALVRAARAEDLPVAAVVLSHTTPPGADDGPAAPRTIACEAAAEIVCRTGLPVAILDHGADRMPPGIDWLAVARG
jgi:beta-phosphoglucomutase-like phosphatase (HAD superfamily)